MKCPKCGEILHSTGAFNLFDGGTYVCTECEVKVDIAFEDLTDEEKDKYLID